MKRLLILLLLTIPTCASLPTARELPPIPSSAPTRYGPIPIRFVPDLQCLGGPAWGCFTSRPYLIQLREGMPRDQSWRVLYHELVHVAVFAANARFTDSTAADTVAEIISRERIIELRAGWPP